MMISEMTQKSNKCLELYNTALNNFKDIIELLDDNLGEQLSLLDKKQSDLLHIVEHDEGVNVYTQYDLMSDLKMIRRERRDIKNMMELSNLIKTPILTFIQNQEINEFKMNNISTMIMNPIYKVRDEDIYDKYVDIDNVALQLKADTEQIKK